MNGKPWSNVEKTIICQIFRVQVSEDHGKTWRVRALCDECFKKIEPPKLAKKEIEAGSYSCDWCGARNVMYVKK
ncbi:MAG TPA: hypothetical protein PKY82_34680 [Pyrinomonadaceae bacterium]|nr:hypothetical protein [Pyrinomonadaceae bacterium]